jgi:SAM-dependent methyltransferase
MTSWIDYWNSDHPIYVNERHKALHASGIVRDFARHIPSGGAAVLDYGCGEALYAEDVTRLCRWLVLSDAAPAVRDKLRLRTAHLSAITVEGPEDTTGRMGASFDLIVVNSLLQYLDIATLEGLLDLWKRLLKPGGKLVIADVIPLGVSPVTDAAALLRFGWQGGFLGAALLGLIRMALSGYRKLRGELGFFMHREADFIALLARHGLQAARVQQNFGHNQTRMTFVAVAGN